MVKKSKNNFYLNKKKSKKIKLDSLLTAREEGENFESYYSFVALSSKKLSANRQTYGRTDGRIYDIGKPVRPPFRFSD
jgi:hypothetical protein